MDIDGEKRIYVLNADKFEFKKIGIRYLVNFYELKKSKFLFFEFNDYELIHSTASRAPITVIKINR